jgi:hypothetical protein
MGCSYDEWHAKYSKEEKEQLIATYTSQNNRSFVMSTYPVQRVKDR